MAASFNPEDKASWYFGPITRQDATELLLSEKESGVFLIRDSASCIGDFVLCVKEDSKVSHYIINRTHSHGDAQYRIGTQQFPALPALLAFYKVHYLDTAPLIRPAIRRVERVVAKYDFEGKDAEDLPFRKGEILTVISKDEEQWWTALNAHGLKGSIPVPYIQRICEDGKQLPEVPRPGSGGSIITPQAELTAKKGNQINRKLPALAKVKQVRIPNAYDKTALKLEIGEVITVTKTNINGQWEGELNGKIGHFPFTHVEFIENEES